MRENKDKYFEAHDQTQRLGNIVENDQGFFERKLNFQMEALHKITAQRDAWIAVAHKLREHGLCYACETFIASHHCDWQEAVAEYEKLYTESNYAHEVHDG